jgi:MFS family permease
MYVAGVLLIMAGTRVFDLSTEERPQAIDWRRPNIKVTETVRWLARQPAVTTMVIVGVVSGTANIVLQTLAPRYVVSALHVDPANAVYVFAPSAFGLIVALGAAPSLMRRWGERLTALSGFAVTALALLLLGIVDDIAPIVDPFNPLRIINLFGAPLSEELRTAALLALPLGFGVSLTTTSVQTYTNRRVPLEYQGRAFALQSTAKNAVAIVPLLTLGAAAAAFGVQQVLLVSPFVLLGLAYALVQLSYRFAGAAPPSRLDVVASFWEADAPVDEEPASEAGG